MFKKRRINHSRGTVNMHVKSDGTMIYEDVIDLTKPDKIAEEEEESVTKEKMEKAEKVLEVLNEEAVKENIPLIPEKRTSVEPSTQEVIATARKVTEDLDWLRQESMKESLERKLEGTSDPYQERDRRILGRERKKEKSRFIKMRSILKR